MNYISAHCSIKAGTVLKNGNLLAASVSDAEDFLYGLYSSLGINYPKFHKMDNLSKLGFLAAEILLKDRNISQDHKPGQIGVILSNKSSCLDTDFEYHETEKEAPSPSLFVYTLPNIVIGEICIRNNFKGENSFFIFEEFNTKFISRYVEQLLNEGVIDCCICGWVDLMGNQHEAFLYLAEKTKTGLALPHVEENIKRLKLHGTID